MPLTTLGAVGALAALIGLSVSRRFRHWLDVIYELSGPAAERRQGVLDLLRGWGALHVFCFHLWQWSQPLLDPLASGISAVRTGNKGVPIFAALSGFLIYGICTRLQTVTELKAFAGRRFFRIYPLYALTAALALATSLDGASFRAWVSNLLMLPIVNIGTPANALAWSIYVEEIFYAACPFVVAGLRCLPPRRRAVLLTTVAVVVMLLVTRDTPREAKLWPYFLAGILAFEARDLCGGTIRTGWAWLLFVAGFAVLARDVFCNDDQLRARVSGYSDAPGYTGDLLVAVFLILFASTSSTTLDQRFRIRPVRFLACISYSLYLLQPFVIKEGFGRQTLDESTLGAGFSPALVVAAKSLAMIAFAAVGYAIIERPFLTASKSPAPPASATD